MNLQNVLTMDSFEKLQSEWKKQSEIKVPEGGFQALLNRVNTIKTGQKITNAVLSATVLILAIFFIYIAGYKNNQVFLGLSLMIGSLVVRIAIEVFSVKNLKNISAVLSVNLFKEKLTSYYKNRRKVHYVLTPLILIIYSIGFLILLPIFKENMSAGFYSYIVFSSITLLVVFCVFIYVQIQKELIALKNLNKAD